MSEPSTQRATLLRQRADLIKQGCLFDCWVGQYRPGGTAVGRHVYFQLRSRKPLENGRYSRHLAAGEVETVQRDIANARRVRKIDKALAAQAKSKQGARAVLTSSASDEWYTPPDFIAYARQVMGGIDLDPASHPIAQQWIQATTSYVVSDEGLIQPWHGRVWLNPPYGSQTALWTDRLITEYVSGAVSAAVLLVRPAVGTAWYQRLCARYPCCLPEKRIRFINGQGIVQSQPVHGNAFFYLGTEPDTFRRVFRALGPVLTPV